MTTATATAKRAPLVLPVDSTERGAYLSTMLGSYITLISGDCEVAGVLVTVIQPARYADHAAPVVVIDNGIERVAGPVLVGDRLI